MPTNITFKRANKTQARLRLALIGPAGSGKTMTALQIATALGGPVAVMDTEHGSASKYASLFEFDSFEPVSFHPQTYIDAIRVAEEGGYKVLIIDSLSHAWSGKDGALELVDRAAKRNQGGNSFSAWRDVTPLHNALVEALIGSRLHVIATMRAKTDYVQEKDDRGRTVIRKVGLQPVQRDGLEYEFDVVADLNWENELIIGKTRCSALAKQVFVQDGAGVARVLSDWLSEGAPAPDPTSEEASFTPVHKPPTQPVEPTPPTADHSPASDKQRAYIARLQDDLAWTSEQMTVYAGEQGIDLVTLTKNQAGVFIEGLKSLVEGRGTLAKTNGNGKKPATREGMIKRIVDLTDEANRIKLPVLLPKPLDEMSDAELLAYGKSLSQSVEQAKAQAGMDELFPDKLPDAPSNGRMKEEPLPL